MLSGVRTFEVVVDELVAGSYRVTLQSDDGGARAIGWGPTPEAATDRAIDAMAEGIVCGLELLEKLKGAEIGASHVGTFTLVSDDGATPLH